MEKNSDSQWVREKLSATEVEWEPRIERARRLLSDHRPRPQRPLRWVAASAVLAGLLGVIIWPGSQAIAQDLWFRLVMNRVAVVRLDLSRLDLKSSISMNGNFETETPAAEVAAKAGFEPYWPPVGNPVSIRVTGGITMSQTVSVAKLRQALEQAGVADLKVPDEWEGVVLKSDIGTLVMADYPGDVQLLQTRAARLEVPAAFPLGQFAETAMRAVGMGWWEAKLFGRKFAQQPAWIIEIPDDEEAKISEIALRSGPAMQIEEHNQDDKSTRVSVIYSTEKRLYVVSAPSVSEARRVANALD